MNAKSSIPLAGFLVLSVSALVGQSQFSGIYKGTVSYGAIFKAAVTPAGRVLGFDQSSEGLGDAINPSKSTVDATGKFKGSTQNGASIVGNITTDRRLKGSYKLGNSTYRLSGKRIFR